MADFLFVTRWMPDPNGGGTQQRAAAHVRALADCGRVHLLYLGEGPSAVAPALRGRVATVTDIRAVRRHLPDALLVDRTRSAFARMVGTAWGMSGLIVQATRSERLAIAASLPTRRFDGVFAFHLGSACLVNGLDILRSGASRVVDWDFLESPNVLPAAVIEHGELTLGHRLSAHGHRLKLLAWERTILKGWQGHLCSSAVDLLYLRQRCAARALVMAIPNSAPVQQTCPPPPPPGRPPTVIFVGTFGYPPNADGARHFVADIWPVVRTAIPNAELMLVGRAMRPDLRAMHGCNGTSIHESVPSLGPFYRDAHVAIVPLRFAVGSNLKIPEAMAYGRAVVGYVGPCERHGADPTSGVVPVGDAASFARAVIELLSAPAHAAELGALAHEEAKTRFASDVIDRRLTTALQHAFALNP